MGEGGGGGGEGGGGGGRDRKEKDILDFRCKGRKWVDAYNYLIII